VVRAESSESRSYWEVVAEVADGKDAISKMVETKPGIAVLEYPLPLVDGIEATEKIRALLPRTQGPRFHDARQRNARSGSPASRMRMASRA